MSDDTALLLERHFDLAFAAPDGIKKLRELILTLAMQGKLVPQDPNDQPASELLKEIETEKKRLVKEGKIRQPKPLPEIKAEEVPYEVPEGWAWVRLGSVSTKLTDGSHTPPKDSGSGYPMLSSQNVNFGRIDFSNPSRYVDESNFHTENKRTNISPGDILLTIVASLGRPAVVPNDAPKFVLQRSVAVISAPINSDFLCRHLGAPVCINYYSEHGKGTAQKGIYLGQLSEMLIALPPLAEQHRIVAKIDQLMARCDELEKLRNERNQKRITVHTAALNRLLSAASSPSPPHRPESSRLDSRLRGNDAEFPGNDTEFSTSPSHSSLPPSPSLPRRRESSRLDFHPREQDSEFAEAWSFITQHFGELYSVKENVAELRKAILQLAVMGKLVPQDPNDQPASELLKEIEAEKRRLVKEGKIKQQKPLPEIGAEEVPYEVPEGWEWARLGSAAKLVEYGTSIKSNDSSKIPVYRMGNILDGQLINSGFKYVDHQIDDLPRLYLRKDDILFNRTNSYELVGKTAIYLGKDNSATFASYLIRIRLAEKHLWPAYFNMAMNAPYFRRTQIEPEIVQQCGQANFNGSKLSATLVPIPPLAEQHRIVAKIDQLMALCDHLEQQIDTATSKQIALLSAVIAQV